MISDVSRLGAVETTRVGSDKPAHQLPETTEMAYLSLYRKYRSQSFEEISGQSHIVRTLQNAIRSDKVGHAYLFCGPRGTGKTSTARLLAKAINCERGPAAEPCNVCDACVQISEGRHLDVFEIDAASNRGIDDIRDLRDNVAFAPASGRRKVYLVDEAHQITNEGFNALLKTLEEPPPFVVFILATTDAQKLPATIVSRCQRFDFHRGTLEELRDRIAFVARAEGASLDADAIDLIAREANGGWRDALSMLEQVLAYCETTVTVADVYQVLGTVGFETLFELAEAILAGNGAGAFQRVDDSIAAGKDARQLLRDLSGYFRELMLCAAGLPSLRPREEASRLTAQAKLFGAPRLVQALEYLAQTEKDARWSEHPRFLVELAVARILFPPAPVAAAAGAAIPAPAPAAVSERPQSRPTPTPAPTPVPVRTETAATVRETRPPVDTAWLPPPPLTVGDARTGGRDDEDDYEFLPEAPVRPDRPGAPPTQTGALPRFAPVSSPASGPPAGREPTPAGSGGPDLEVVQRKWRLVLEELKRGRKMTLYAILAESSPASLEGDVLYLRFPYETHTRLFAEKGPVVAEPLQAVIQQLTGVVCRVRALGAPADSKNASTGSVTRSSPTGSTAAARPAPEAAPPSPRREPEPNRASPRAEPMFPAAAPPSGAPPARSAGAGAPPAPSGGIQELVHDVLEVFDGHLMTDGMSE